MNPYTVYSRILDARGLSQPDGRPLYAYRCKSSDLVDLREVLRTGLTAQPGGLASGLFCLYAAEWWRREHASGPWSWAGILEGIGAANMSFPRRYKIVEQGLRHWERPLLRIATGRGFLVTLACEGGLPLQLVKRESAALRHYFDALLDEFQLSRERGEEPSVLAERVASRLPQSLRHDVVYRLGGEIVDKIWELRSSLGRSIAPVHDLDALRPNWREELPLEVDDDVARVLLNPLVEKAAILTRRGSARILLRRSLRRTKAGLVLVAEPMLPTSIYQEQLEQIFGTGAMLPDRFELWTQAESGELSQLAMATLSRVGEARSFVLEPGRGNLQIEGVLATGRRMLVATFGDRFIGPVPVQGGSELTDLPWVFVEREGHENDYTLIGQGSVRTQKCPVFVASSSAWHPAASGDPAEELGTVVGLDRIVRSHRDVIRYADRDGGLCAIRPLANGGDIPTDFQLTGASLPLGRGARPVYLGMPSLVEWKEGHSPQRIPIGTIEWCTRRQGTWRALSLEALGRVFLRQVRDGETLCRVAVDILPASARLVVEPSAEAVAGLVGFDGVAGATLRCDSSPTIDVESLRQPGRVALALRSVSGTEPPDRFNAVMEWSAGRQLDLELPFPIQGARFVSADGKVLRREASVPVDRLASVRAVATPASNRGTCSIRAELFASDVASEDSSLDFSAPLRAMPSGRLELPLQAVRETIAQLLASSKDLDAQVRLTLEADASSGKPPARIHVRRYDLALEADFERGEVRLKSLSREDDDGRDSSDFVLTALPLWKPGVEPVQLERVISSEVGTSWFFDPLTREPGPWLIIGRQNDWYRVRPMLWSVRGPASISQTALESAVCVEDRRERATRIRQAIEDLARNPLRLDEWRAVHEFISAVRIAPATTFDVLNELVAHPTALVTALLTATDVSSVDAVWLLEDSLPFLWCLVPMQAWSEASERLADGLRMELAETGLDTEDWVRKQFSTFFDRAATLHSYLVVVRELIEYQVLEVPLQACRHLSWLCTAKGRQGIPLLLSQDRQDLLRIHADDRWPQGSNIRQWKQVLGSLPSDLAAFWDDGHQEYQVAVLNAPLVAALSNVFERPIGRPLFNEIRRCSSFDPNWFRNAFTNYLAAALGQIAQDKER